MNELSARRDSSQNGAAKRKQPHYLPRAHARTSQGFQLVTGRSDLARGEM